MTRTKPVDFRVVWVQAMVIYIVKSRSNVRKVASGGAYIIVNMQYARRAVAAAVAAAIFYIAPIPKKRKLKISQKLKTPRF